MTNATTNLQKNMRLELKIVVLPRHANEGERGNAEPLLPYIHEDSLLINSGEFSGLGCQEAQHNHGGIRAATWIRQAVDYVSAERLGH